MGTICQQREEIQNPARYCAAGTAGKRNPVRPVNRLVCFYTESGRGPEAEVPEILMLLRR